MDEIFKAIIYLKDFCHSYDNCLQCPIFIPEKGICQFSYKKPRYWSYDDTILRGLSANKEGD